MKEMLNEDQHFLSGVMVYVGELLLRDWDMTEQRPSLPALKISGSGSFSLLFPALKGK